jgi:hypothetical protein
MSMDLSKLSLGDKIIAVSGILLFIFSFFSWLGVKVSGAGSLSASGSKSAWGFTLTLLAVLLGILLVAYVVLKALDVKLPELGAVTWGQIALGVAVVVALFIVIKIIAGPSGVNTGSFGSVSVSKQRKIGIFLGFLASLGLVAGAYLNAREAGDLPESLGGKRRGDTTPPPGPPPTA